MKRVVLLPLALAIVLSAFATPPRAPAQEPQILEPVAVLTLDGYEELKGHVAFVGKLIDNPNLGVGLEAMLKLFTKNRGLDGLDKSRQFGGAVLADGPVSTGFAFIPVTNLDALLDVLEGVTGKPKQVAAGIHQIETDGRSLFVAEPVTGWAVVADSQAQLERFSGQPGEMMAGLGEQYDLAVRVYAANVPEHFRTAFLDELRRGAERDAGQRDGETAEQYAVRRRVIDLLVANVAQVVADLDTVTLGVTFDHDLNTAAIETSLIFTPGSPMAEASAALTGGPSRFVGFRMDAATLWAAWTGQMPQAKADALGALLVDVRAAILKDIQGQGKAEEEEAFARRMVNEVFDMLARTVASRQVDGGAAVLLKSDAATLVAGLYTDDPTDIEKTLRDVAGIVALGNPELAAAIRLDAETCHGVRLHTASLPIPDDAENREQLVALVGPKLDVVVGFGRHGVYLAAGRDAISTLERAIEQSAARTGLNPTPFEMTVALEPLLRFIGAMGEEPDRPKARRIADELVKTAGKDHLRMTGQAIPHGIKYRLEIEEALLRLVPKLQAIEQGQ